MFYYLNGTLAALETPIAVIDCGGVGYQLTVSNVTAALLGDKIGKTTKLLTHLAVREDGIELFGFISREERECFMKLTSVSGIGPKAAMSILSTMTPDDLALAIASEDTKAIARAPGIGAKTAARVVLELKDKISKDMMSTSPQGLGATAAVAMPVGGALADATEALMALGYDKNTVLGALKGVDTKGADAGALIRLALKKLAR
jgi:Holliday junction DNA helicase RuvA